MAGRSLNDQEPSNISDGVIIVSVHLVRNQSYNLTTGEVTEDDVVVNAPAAHNVTGAFEEGRRYAARTLLAKNDVQGFHMALRAFPVA